jgi:TPR repeat protein
MYERDIDSDDAAEYVDGMFADAVAAFKRDAATGDSYAMRRLAELYRNGEGVTRDYEEARKSYTAASERGDAWSTFQLGRMLARGEGGPKELMNAQLLYLRAAATGDMNVQSAYGELYLKGEDGVAKEQSLAIKLFKLAAAQGEPKAQAHLKALGVKWD